MICGSNAEPKKGLESFTFEELVYLKTNLLGPNKIIFRENFIEFTNRAKQDYKDSPEKLNKMLSLLKEEVKINSINLMYRDRYSVLKNKIDGNPQPATIQAPKAQAQVLTPKQIESKNTYCEWLYRNWNTNASKIIEALNANCPSEEQFTEFATFLQDQNNLNLNAIKTKVSELTGRQIP